MKVFFIYYFQFLMLIKNILIVKNLKLLTNLLIKLNIKNFRIKKMKNNQKLVFKKVRKKKIVTINLMKNFNFYQNKIKEIEK